jgi:hypothetical protein
MHCQYFVVLLLAYLDHVLVCIDGHLLKDWQVMLSYTTARYHSIASIVLKKFSELSCSFGTNGRIVVSSALIFKCFRESRWLLCAAPGALAVNVLATGPTGYSVAGSNPTEDSGFLWVIKIPSAHFLWRGSKAVGLMS